MRARLRRETTASHAELDAIFAPMIDTGDYGTYRRFLSVSHACHGAVEDALSRTPLPRIVPDWAQRSRMAALEADLEAMSIAPLPRPAFLLGVNDTAGAFGAAYVLEGSRLGAKFITRRLREFGVEVRWAAASFRFVAADPERRFVDFAAILDAQAFDEADAASCCAAADRAFRFFIDAANAAPASHLPESRSA